MLDNNLESANFPNFISEPLLNIGLLQLLNIELSIIELFYGSMLELKNFTSGKLYKEFPLNELRACFPVKILSLYIILLSFDIIVDKLEFSISILLFSNAIIDFFKFI